MSYRGSILQRLPHPYRVGGHGPNAPLDGRPPSASARGALVALVGAAYAGLATGLLPSTVAWWAGLAVVAVLGLSSLGRAPATGKPGAGAAAELPVVVAAMPWIYALAWAALRYRLRLDGMSVAAAAPWGLFLGVGGVASITLFLAARSALYSRWPRRGAWAFIVLTAVMVTGALARPPRSGATTTGALKLLVEPIADEADWMAGNDAEYIADQEIARLPVAASVRLSDPPTDLRRPHALGPFTLGPVTNVSQGAPLPVTGPGLPAEGAMLLACLTYADVGLRVSLYPDPARACWFVVCDGSDSQHRSTVLGERGAHYQPIIRLVHRTGLHPFSGRTVRSDPSLDTVRVVQRGAIPAAVLAAVGALAWLVRSRRRERAAGRAKALIALLLATAPLGVTWAFALLR
ncbi:MAG: hypothetical protein JWM10_251 [Myxococcaceae bacterium]|nr:hypothetical protein [Myxococcaceae bacterium]